MPTGYTAKLMEEGQTFEEYALLCARAFGATILMRDEPLDKPIPQAFAASDWNTKRLAESKAELTRLEEMGGNERIAFGEALRAEAIASRKSYIEKEQAENARLLAVRAQVEAWEPPSPEHVEYKAFMLNQIDISKHDIAWSEKYLVEAEAKSPAAYYAEAVATAARGIEYHAVEQQKENERTEQRNRWVRQLREGLKCAATA